MGNGPLSLGVQVHFSLVFCYPVEMSSRLLYKASTTRGTQDSESTTCAVPEALDSQS